MSTQKNDLKFTYKINYTKVIKDALRFKFSISKYKSAMKIVELYNEVSNRCMVADNAFDVGDFFDIIDDLKKIKLSDILSAFELYNEYCVPKIKLNVESIRSIYNLINSK